MNSAARSETDNRIFFVALAAAAAIGSFLRCYLLNDQVFADDEWHGLYFAIGRTPGWLLTHFSIPGATCIPLNFYTGIAGATVGWSETILRLPSLIFGLLCVVLCPVIARPMIGARQAAWLALLLSISPLLIFYSRIARPYSAVACLGFLGLLSAGRWAQSGQKRWAALFIGSATLAVYFHLFAIVAAIAPSVAAVANALAGRLSRKRAPAPAVPILHWVIAALAIILLSGVLMAPAFIHLFETKFDNVALGGTFEAASLPRAASLLAGTARPLLVLVFYALFIAGAVAEIRRNFWFGGMLVGLVPLYSLALLLSRPDGAQSALVLVRYSIPLAPACLLLVACGIQRMLDAVSLRLEFRPLLQCLAAFGIVAALAIAGPLPQCYASPNNFTSHGVFQQSYGPIDWSHSFDSDLTPPGFPKVTVIRADEVSPFYKMLGRHPDGRPIVEYPMMIGDHCDPLYYYQYFHGRPVLVGYATDVKLSDGLSPGSVYGDTYIDQVLSLVRDPSRLHFRNFVSMDDLAAMRARHVEFIVLHKHFEARFDEIALPLPDIQRLYTKYRKELGPPVYEDAHIAVFGL